MIVDCYPIYATGGKTVTYYHDYITNGEKVLPDGVGLSYLVPVNIDCDALQSLFFTSTGKITASYVGSYHCMSEDLEEFISFWKTAYESYRGKDTSIVAYHIVISFPLGAQIENRLVFKIGGEVVKELRNYPAIWSAHIEPVKDEKTGRLSGQQKHVHILISAYPEVRNEAPRKLDLGHHNQRLRVIADRLAIEHHQEIIVDADYRRANSHFAAIKAQSGESWVTAARCDIREAAESATDWDSYVNALAERDIVTQQIGPRFRYQVQGGHTIMDYKLGRPYTLECLEEQWAAKREGFIDEYLSAFVTHDRPLKVRIPLGGRFKEATEWVDFDLESDASRCSDDVLRSYFKPGCTYQLVCENGDIFRLVEGKQILDYLGVNLRVPADEANLPATVYQRRLKRRIERIRIQTERDCERYTKSAAIRFDYLCRKRRLQDERWLQEEPEWYKPRTPTPTWGEILFELIMSFLIPDYEKLFPEPKTPEEEVADRRREEEIQRLMDAIHIVAEEGIHGQEELEIECHASKRLCQALTEDLAAIDLELEDCRAMMAALNRCKERKKRFDHLVRSASEPTNYQEFYGQHKDEVDAYEDAVREVAQFCIAHWGSIEQLFNRYRYLSERRPLLLESLAAEFERSRKLSIANEAISLSQMKQYTPHYHVTNGSSQAQTGRQHTPLMDAIARAEQKKLLKADPSIRRGRIGRNERS